MTTETDALEAEQKHEEPALEVHLEKFSGPLDLLLHLIDRNKVSIYDIPIAEITDQYLLYLDRMQKADLGVMSEFLVMAATLLDIKSRMLLPREETEDEEETDPRDDLVRQLVEYKMYRCIASELKDMEESADRVFFREPDIPPEVRSYEEPVDVQELTAGITLSDLEKIFGQVMARKEDRVDPIRSSFGEIRKEPVTVDEKIEEVRRFVGTHRRTSFRALLEKGADKTEVIVTFLAILELMKSGAIRTEQDGLFADIMITAAGASG